jgi:hypothetical protein
VTHSSASIAGSFSKKMRFAEIISFLPKAHDRIYALTFPLAFHAAKAAIHQDRHTERTRMITPTAYDRP